jgi:hypothetical protein
MDSASERRRSAGRAGLGLAALALAALLGMQGQAMANKVIFSAVSGQVLLQGQPVAGAQVARSARWDNEQAEDGAATSADGRFSLPPITRKRGLLESILPSEPFIEQSILIQHGGKTYKAWVFRKRNFRDDGELDGRPIRMTCRLDSEPQSRGKVFGVCELD